MKTVQALDQRIAQLKQQRAAVAARERARERKRDTRCKIILGSGLLALVRAGDPQAVAVYRTIRSSLDERAAKAFEGWTGEPSMQSTHTMKPTPEGPA